MNYTKITKHYLSKEIDLANACLASYDLELKELNKPEYVKKLYKEQITDKIKKLTRHRDLALEMTLSAHSGDAILTARNMLLYCTEQIKELSEITVEQFKEDLISKILVKIKNTKKFKQDALEEQTYFNRQEKLLSDLFDESNKFECTIYLTKD